MMKRKSCDNIGELYNRFTNSKITIDRCSTDYTNEFKRFLKDTELTEDSPISLLTEENIIKWTNIMRDRGLKPASIKHYLSAIRVFLYWGMENGYIEQFKIKIQRYQNEQLKFYTEDELKTLLKKPTNDFISWRTYTIIAFILSTGARASTILNIKLEDIDLKNREVYYRHLKNKDTAIIPLTDQIVNIINDYLNNWDVEEWLFPDVRNNQLTYSGLRQSIDRHCIKCGVESKGIHSFRHSFAREWIKSDGDSFTLQRLLTHSTMDMTRNYVKLFSDDMRPMVNNHTPLGKLLPQSNKRIMKKRCI